MRLAAAKPYLAKFVFDLTSSQHVYLCRMRNVFTDEVCFFCFFNVWASAARLRFIMQPSSAFMQSVYHCVPKPFSTSKSVKMSRGTQLCVELVVGKVAPEGAA